jgi:hypothetical protein
VNRITEWIKEHPYLAGGLVLGIIVFYVVYKSVSGSGSSGGVAVASGPSDAVQAAAIQAGLQQQQTSAAATTANNQIQAQLAALQLQYGAQLQVAQLAANAQNQQTLTQGQTDNAKTDAELQAALASIGGQVQVAGEQTSAGVQIAGIQGGIAAEQIQAALAATENTNAASVSIAGINSQTMLGVAGDQLTLGLAQNSTNQVLGLEQLKDALAALQNTNATQLDIVNSNNTAATTINAQNNQTTQVQANDATDVYNNYINTMGVVDLTALQDQLTATQGTQGIQQSIVDLIGNGTFNKGGAGGANQVAALSALTGLGSGPASAAENGAAVSSTAPWSALNGLFGAVAKVGVAAGA